MMEGIRSMQRMGRSPLFLAVALLIAFAGIGAGRSQPASAAPVAVASAEPDDEVGRMLERARTAELGLRQAEGMYAEEVAPIAEVLRTYRNDPELTHDIAVALVREAHRAGLEPRVLLSVLLVENPMLETRVRSFVGAVGLMQVMPLHRGNWRACEPDLESIDGNICHGAQIFASYLRQSDGDVDRALLRYNGCVRGTNTPNCHGYPSWVYARAGKVSMMSWLSSARAHNERPHVMEH